MMAEGRWPGGRMRTDHVDTPSSEVGDQPLPTLRPPQAMLRVATHSDRGRVRANNEDRFLVVRADRTTTPIATNIDAGELRFVPAQTIWALAVADGMGGHAAGEVASTLALTLALQYAQQGSRWYVDIGEREAREIVGRVESILASVNRAIAEQADRESALAGMGTTLTVAVVRGDRLFVYHVGDSRAYLLRQGHLVRITRDQTVAQQLADSGLIADGLVGSHSARHLLTQAIGRGDVDVEVHHFPLQHGDRLVLSTDGLTDGVEDAEVEQVCREGDCEQACQQLIERALAAGGRDNVTVVVADVDIMP
jgi:PPM family protein phosphatase